MLEKDGQMVVTMNVLVWMVERVITDVIIGTVCSVYICFVVTENTCSTNPISLPCKEQ